MREVCVDACIAAKWVVAEPLQELATALLSDWCQREVQMVAPPFFFVEVDSILRRKTVLVRNPPGAAELTEEEAEGAFRQLLGTPIDALDLPGQRERAWDLAGQSGFATVYDATYMALAVLRNCEFRTADDKLFDWVKDKFPLIRHLSSYAP